MYNSYFGFRDRPFAAVPQVDHYFAAEPIESARATLARCIERGEGVGMVLGPSGTGKTLLCHVLAEQFRPSMQIAQLSSGRLSSRRALLQAILYELGRPYRGMDEGELRLALVDYLSLSENCPNGMLLLVDEAHTLPLRLLDEVRMLTNLTRRGQPRVRLVLAGGRLLEERFASPKLDSFSQRIVARCYLEALSRTDTHDYIQTRINAAGGRGEVLFPEATCQSVHRATDGVPRLVNQVCDHALVLAYANGRRVVESALVEEAWGDLQQLPTPWNDPSQREQSGGVIEFGRLDDASAASADEGPPDGAVLPALRVTPEDAGESPPAAVPTEQMDCIEQVLAGAGEDFCPAGSLGPEVELFFDEPGSLLAEEFEHEEVVADRYAGQGKTAGQPPAQEIAAYAAGGPQTTSGQPNWPPAGAAACEAQPQPAAGPCDHDAAAESDEPLIVVEDEYDPSSAPATCPIVAVRPQEYGQLFARLRRG